MVVIFASALIPDGLGFVYTNYWVNQAIVSANDNKWMPILVTHGFSSLEVGVPIHWVWYDFQNTRRAGIIRTLPQSYSLQAHVTASL